MERVEIDVLDLADKAARCTLRGRSIWTREDWEDATQEAASAIWVLQDRGEGYAFLAAKRAIYDWMRSWLRHPRGGTLLEYIRYPDQERNEYTIDYISSLYSALCAQGSKKPDEDLRYLELRLAGYSTSGIALEMGISERNVYAIRERLLPRLDRITRGEAPLPRGEAVRRGLARACAYRAVVGGQKSQSEG